MDPRDARNLIDGMQRAREITGADDAPSAELEARVSRAAAKLGVEAATKRTLDALTGGMIWHAGVRTGRGECWAAVNDGDWEQAWREVGLLD